MDINDNERLQEFFLVVGDKLAPVKKIWWYVLIATIVFIIPFYFLLKLGLTQIFLHGYRGPTLLASSIQDEPLQVLDKQIFTLPGGTYSGYILLKNLNLESGVTDQEYKADFKTFGGTVLNTVDQTTYILPASEKMIVLPRFSATQKPDELDVTLGQSHFIVKPDVSVNFQIERTTLANNSSGLVVSSEFINQTPFTITQVDLPVAVYNSQNQIVAVSYTNINDVLPSETRTFQYSWPAAVAGAVRAEINPEINIFDPTIFSTTPAIPESDSSSSR